MSNNDPIKLRVENGIAEFILDKPPENRMDKSFLNHMCQTVFSIKEATDIRAVVVYGSGRHFSAGADVNYVKNSVLQPYEQGVEYEQIISQNVFSPSQALREFENLEVPTIAAINGLCMGSGLELALACDIRICGNNAIMGSPELSWGIITGLGGSFRLERLIGKARAKEMLLRGDVITGQEACHMGLVSKSVDRKKVLPSALRLAEVLSQKDRSKLNAIIKKQLALY